MVIVCRGTEKPKTIKYIEYLEATGTQWIDTGVYTNQNSRILVDTTILSVNTSNIGGYVFGSSSPSTKNGYEVYAYDIDLRASYANQDFFNEIQLQPGSRLLIDFNKNNFDVFNGESKYTSHVFDTEQFSSLVTLKLFRLGRSGETWMGNVRIHSCKIYDGESIIKDYRPCLDDNGTPCMWENVSKEYVYNSGTGSFVSGPEV